MVQKIRVGAVSYLNTKPLIYGFEQGMMKEEIDLVIDYPANIAAWLIDGRIDAGLVPVAALPFLKEHHVVSEYCIACDGEVASVCLFSEVPLEQIETVLLDYQSRTSVGLLKILLKEHWKISPKLVDGSGDYENDINGTTAGLVIGDRALAQRLRSKYIYDLGLAWKEMTGLPFVFAAWISNRKLPAEFCRKFDLATGTGLTQIDKVLAGISYEHFSLEDYYSNFIKFRLDKNGLEAVSLFLNKLKNYS